MPLFASWPKRQISRLNVLPQQLSRQCPSKMPVLHWQNRKCDNEPTLLNVSSLAIAMTPPSFQLSTKTSRLEFSNRRGVGTVSDAPKRELACTPRRCIGLRKEDAFPWHTAQNMCVLASQDFKQQATKPQPSHQPPEMLCCAAFMAHHILMSRHWTLA